MSRHATRVLEIAVDTYGAVCTCGWRSQSSKVKRTIEIEANNHAWKAGGIKPEDPNQIGIPGTDRKA